MPKVEEVPDLLVEQLPIFRVNYRNLEKFIESVFGFEFDFKFAAGVTEGTGVEYNVDGVLPTPSWQRRADELREGRRTRSVPLILAVLTCDGFIRPGRYTIVT